MPANGLEILIGRATKEGIVTHSYLCKSFNKNNNENDYYCQHYLYYWAVLFYRKIRELISDHLAQEGLRVFNGEVELDESYFGGVRKGKRSRGAADKVVVFGLLKRSGHVYSKIVGDTKTTTLMPIISAKIAPDSIVYTDNYRLYNELDV